ncbi:unnamed protein product [Protopolystoma xenopodis]|uniref:Uncharacterized protein n=1 Tax=Protopolystoma xenopodis TaxID=117903 RepID=A0A448X1Q9_9PLAT|nr:unnamed protein product [Protopolystoma xenopodis]
MSHAQPKVREDNHKQPILGTLAQHLEGKIQENPQAALAFADTLEIPWVSVLFCLGNRSKADAELMAAMPLQKPGLVRDLNPGPLAPKARIIPLDQRACACAGSQRLDPPACN